MTAILFICVYGVIGGLVAYVLVMQGLCVDIETHTNHWPKPYSSYTTKTIEWAYLVPASLFWPAAILWVPIAIGGRAAKKEIGVP